MGKWTELGLSGRENATNVSSRAITDKSFLQYYDEIHIPLSISICIFGAASNVFNIIVLTRKRMRTPINILLTGLSIAQWLLATNYFLYLLLEYYRYQCVQLLWSEAFTRYRFFNVNLNTVFHTIAFTTTIVVAVFRYCALKFPIQANRFIYKCQPAIAANVIIWIIIPIISLPLFFISEVKIVARDHVAYDLQCEMEGPLYDLSYQESPLLVSAVFWAFGIVFKLLPSLILSILLIALIRSLKSVERRRKNWKRTQGANICTNSERKAKRKLTTRPRTTRMLVIILLLCVMVELPMGILNLCVAIYGEEFGNRYYDPVGNLMEMLTLLYSSVSFVLYCTMSNEYLSTFRALFFPWTRKNSLRGTRRSWNHRHDDETKSPRTFLINRTAPSSYVGS
ncbi:G-protein coupled receptors family 1 profile domain-containing protein [Caenorhabditis elegans]|uniref:G protein-coupled receptor EGL-6 isoform b n=1 Tax=Caenorhabditis elegans TaxID=6239 RepID=G5EFX1_CAEEL|nr:G-protein coupled receptors family 1 profile domain-containing protein [Caenorhabditis elegans]ACG61342.1 G protein-coupled receptor EGL-6 isoform b [Caenorhabditis elegans]CCD67505.1 G-protein coupled receptors family 1 profile domain-containing protein [Caenorhabditis elegans]|eukprot:NP_001257033.1 Uncharacterized protein CELE_C46F4.1 [Caenorhabditis elegans]